MVPKRDLANDAAVVALPPKYLGHDLPAVWHFADEYFVKNDACLRQCFFHV